MPDSLAPALAGTAVRLDLGAGGHSIPGFQPLDGARGDTIYPLPWPDRSVDEIRASHVLEHFPQAQCGDVIHDWCRALKPGGVLRVAVPDFEKIARAYLNDDTDWPLEGYLMGGQTDARDFHKAVFDRDGLEHLLRECGMEIADDWVSEIQDCAALPVSLNLTARKPLIDAPTLRRLVRPAGRVMGIMSVPRLGFMDNFFCAIDAFPAMNISLRKFTGAFWNQCLTMGLEYCLGENAEWILTSDYDTVFRRDDVAALLDLAARHPEADAIAAMQSSRTSGHMLLTARGAEGGPARRLALDGELVPVRTAHFGLTMIRASKVASLPRPWLQGVPDAQGSWGDGRTDADIAFWRSWEAAGNTLFIAPRVVVGHSELMILWPGPGGRTIFQKTHEFWESGKPAEAMG